MRVCMYVRTHAHIKPSNSRICMYVCMYVCMHVCPVYVSKHKDYFITGHQRTVMVEMCVYGMREIYLVTARFFLQEISCCPKIGFFQSFLSVLAVITKPKPAQCPCESHFFRFWWSLILSSLQCPCENAACFIFHSYRCKFSSDLLVCVCRRPAEAEAGSWGGLDEKETDLIS
jgi:hypothetical protein